MANDFHYPAFNEKGVSIDRYMKDMPQYVEDYNVMKKNRIPDSEIKVLSDLELITREEAEKYTEAQENLRLGLAEKVKPSDLRDKQAYDAGYACAFIQSLFGTGMGIGILGFIGKDILQKEYGWSELAIWTLAIGCAVTIAATAAVLSFYYFTAESRAMQKKAKTIDLDKAYVDYGIASRPLTEIKTGERTYNPEKERTHEAVEIIAAVKDTNKKIDKMYKHFSRTS